MSLSVTQKAQKTLRREDGEQRGQGGGDRETDTEKERGGKNTGGKGEEAVRKQ